MAAHAIGSATVSFGLVSIPVNIFAASQSASDVSFNLLHKACNSRLKQQYVCTKDGAVSLFCADCDFYKESDKDLECGAFKLLRLLIDKKVLTLAQISDAIGK